MIPLVVNSRLHPRQNRLCSHVGSMVILQHGRQCPFPPLSFQSLTTIKFCNSFVLITIQNGRGVYPLGPCRTFKLYLSSLPSPRRPSSSSGFPAVQWKIASLPKFMTARLPSLVIVGR